MAMGNLGRALTVSITTGGKEQVSCRRGHLTRAMNNKLGFSKSEELKILI